MCISMWCQVYVYVNVYRPIPMSSGAYMYISIWFRVYVYVYTYMCIYI